MKYSSLTFLFILVSGFWSHSQDTEVPISDKSWHKFEEPTFFCPTLVIGLEGFNNQNFNDYVCNLIRLKNYQSYDNIRGKFVGEFTLDKNSKFKTIDIIEKIKLRGFDDINMDIIRILEQSLTHWTTAKINGNPIESRIRVTVASSTQIHSDWDGSFEWLITPEFINA